MNPLLARQIRKYLPQVDPADPAWRDFLAAVGSAYTELEQDRDFFEHTLEVASEELTEANEKLRHESERRLASISRYYEQTLELQQGMILCLDHTPEGFRYTLCRGQLLQRLGFASPAEIEGKYVRDVAGPSQALLLNDAFQRVWNGENVSLSFATVDGIELFVLMRPRLEDGIVREIVAACVEVTALKDAERELRAAKERAEAADRAKSDFLAVMSHEIRTPLNGVLGFSEVLKDSPLTPEQKEWVDTICTSGESLLALIDDILDFSKIEAGRLVLHADSISLPTLVEAVMTLFRPRAADKAVALHSEFAPDVPVFIKTDSLRLRQILLNLVGNAVKFTPRGLVRVTVSLAAPPAAPGEPCLLRFTVADTGIGIPPDRRERLFKAFSQVDSSMTRQYGGTGLGLAISHRLAHLLGGEIGVESEPGRGSTFFFTLRAPVVVLPPEPARLPPPTLAASPESGTLRILVAEDQAPNRALITAYLSERGYRPDIVDNGRRALEAAMSKDYDYILMDILMPELDGYAATLAIRRHCEGRRQPRIIALTASVFPEDRARCRAAGMDGFLTKPIDFNLLLAILRGGSPTPF